jgi:type IV secretion system protein VirB10
MANDKINTTTDDDEPVFEVTPEEATGLDSKPKIFNRKRVLMTLCISFAVVVCGGLILNTFQSSNKNKTASNDNEFAATQATNNEFLSSLQNRALRNRRLSEQEEREEAENLARLRASEEIGVPEPPQEGLPTVSVTNVRTQSPPPHSPPQPQQQQQQQFQGGSGGGQQPQRPTHYSSSLVPQVQGSLFQSQPQPQHNPISQQGGMQAGSHVARTNQNPYGFSGSTIAEYSMQNDQFGKEAFFDSNISIGAVSSGYFLGENSLWTGTIIPGVLETAINTDLPGNVLARVTQNIYDSQTGRKLLIPQGSLLIARYNSSVSYAQKRVQIVWNLLIRPDGFQVDLGNANAVDQTGMSGQAGRYHENWFEYIKAAGIITMFSIANASMTETSARYAPEDQAANIAAANAALVNQMGNNMVNRALNIQPRLTVDNGTRINIMLNKTLYLPPLNNFPVNQRYILE